MSRVYALSTVVVVLAKLSGFARGVLFASVLGTSIALDAYNGMLVIAGAVVFIAADQFELLISAETAIEHAKGDRPFRAYVSHAVSIAVAVGVALGILALVLMPLLAPVLVPGARGAADLALVPLAFMLVPLIILHIPSRAMAALLRGSERASLSILLDGLQGLGFLGCGFVALMFLGGHSDSTKVLGVALSQSAGVVGVVTIQFVVLWRSSGGCPLRWQSLRAAVPFGRRIAVISGLNALNYGFTLIDRHFAAKVVTGGLSLVNYAGNVSLTLRAALAYDHLYVVEFSKSRERAKSYTSAVVTCLWLTAPICGVLPVFAQDMVRIVFQRGQFTAEMAAHTGGVLAVYGGFTTAFLLWQLMFRILQLENCLRSMYGAYVVALLVSLVVTPFAVARIGLPGAICGTVAGTLCLLSAGTWLLYRSGVTLFPARRLVGAAALAGYAWLVAEFVRSWVGSASSTLSVTAMVGAGALAYIPTAVWWWRGRGSVKAVAT
jgi:putative peptidoglycan lipid II flippase